MGGVTVEEGSSSGLLQEVKLINKMTQSNILTNRFTGHLLVSCSTGMTEFPSPSQAEIERINMAGRWNPSIADGPQKRLQRGR